MDERGGRGGEVPHQLLPSLLEIIQQVRSVAPIILQAKEALVIEKEVKVFNDWQVRSYPGREKKTKEGGWVNCVVLSVQVVAVTLLVVTVVVLLIILVIVGVATVYTIDDTSSTTHLDLCHQSVLFGFWECVYFLGGKEL